MSSKKRVIRPFKVMVASTNTKKKRVLMSNLQAISSPKLSFIHRL